MCMEAKSMSLLCIANGHKKESKMIVLLIMMQGKMTSYK